MEIKLAKKSEEVAGGKKKALDNNNKNNNYNHFKEGTITLKRAKIRNRKRHKLLLLRPSSKNVKRKSLQFIFFFSNIAFQM